MKKLMYLAALALAAAAIAPIAAFADTDPLAAIKADIAQLKTDVQTKHDAVVADATTLQNDAHTLVGSDRQTARAKIKIDALKLTGDWKSLLSVCLADRLKLRTDINAARQAGAGKGQIRPLVRAGESGDPRHEPADACRRAPGAGGRDRVAPELQERREAGADHAHSSCDDALNTPTHTAPRDKGPASPPGPSSCEEKRRFRRKADGRESGSVPAFRVVAMRLDRIKVGVAESPRLGRILALSGTSSGPRLS